MANASDFWTQADALCRKNLIYQKRRGMENCCLILFPVVLCVMLVLLQGLTNKYLNKDTSGTGNKNCGCFCESGTNCDDDNKVCDLHFSNLDTSNNCPIPSPQQWPPLLQLPPGIGADNQTQPVTVLLTGNNLSFAKNLGWNLFPNSVAINSSNVMHALANIVLGTNSIVDPADVFLDSAFDENALYYITPGCPLNSSLSFTFPDKRGIQKEAGCVQALNLWRNSSSQINEELYEGYNGSEYVNSNRILAAYDLLNTNGHVFNVSVWYDPKHMLRTARSVNLVSNAYLQYLYGFGTKMLFEFVKDMPKGATKTYLDVSSSLGVLFFTLVILRLFPVAFLSLVYEKQQKLRIMMKMHGLGDGPYWMISYAYFLVISLLYMLVFVVFGSTIGLKFFLLNDYSVQFVFYFVYLNLQISMGFLLATLFSHVKTATAVGYLCVYGTGVVAASFFQNFLEQPSFPRGLITALELYPGFSLYRGLYELSQYSLRGTAHGYRGMFWENLSDKENGMSEVLIIMSVEWLLVLFVGYYMDQVLSSGKSPLFFLQKLGKKHPSSFRKPNLQRQGSKIFINMDESDIHQEREKVEQLLLEPNPTRAIICDNLTRVYPGRDGNPDKVAVRELSLAVPPGECFGMLGPNGAGKTSFISMMVGLTKPTSGTAYIQGLDIQTQMDRIYTRIGVCPQHDLLWDTLTGREHLLFYGRLKNLKGSALKQLVIIVARSDLQLETNMHALNSLISKAVEESLRSLKLFDGGVADKQAGKYSGGMKRRLSVAISLIGDPKVVYMDEPSSGLDPAARRNLWNVLNHAKQDRAIILTTHSMEEAEALCDRLGVFVDGSFRCIGNPKELKARYGGSYMLTVTSSPDHEQQVLSMVQELFPDAERIYHTSGTQKFEIPKLDVRIAEVFYAVEIAKTRFPISAWGLSDATLEDVFIKVANDA